MPAARDEHVYLNECRLLSLWTRLPCVEHLKLYIYFNLSDIIWHLNLSPVISVNISSYQRGTYQVAEMFHVDFILSFIFNQVCMLCAYKPMCMLCAYNDNMHNVVKLLESYESYDTWGLYGPPRSRCADNDTNIEWWAAVAASCKILDALESH